MRPLDFLSMSALSFFTAYGLWQIAIRQPDRVQVRIIDLPPVTEAALLTSGIDRQTLNDYLAQTSVEVPYGPVTAYTSQPSRTRISSSIAINQEQEVTPAPGRIERSANQPPVKTKTRERNDGHSRAPKIGQWVKVEISTYSRSYHGNGTHGGERYDHYKGHTAATTIIRGRWVLPKGSVWEVEYLSRTITVRVNDTGSWRPRKAPYWLDLSGAAWRKVAGSPSRHVARMRRVK